MANLSNLVPLLSRDRLKKVAGIKVFERGELYFYENSVELLYHAPNEAAAEVEGSQVYRAELKLVNGKLREDCTCPANAQFGFCKHAVALGLYLIENPIVSHEAAPKTLRPIGAFEEKYPNLVEWLEHGTVELGFDGYSTSRIRVGDEGGTIWEGGTRHKFIDDMLAEAEAAIEQYFE